ncbi:MAG: DUF1566 domain-containing protein [Nitrospirae bacterium]|nr:DUF1566 domain-containing protein [Nitrospirota bacterium]
MIRMIKKAANGANIIMVTLAALALLLPAVARSQEGAGYREFTVAGDNGVGVEQGGQLVVEKDASNSRFVVYKVIVDQTTKLMWTQTANFAGIQMNWTDARTYITDMNAGKHNNFGFTDWRLPRKNELLSLINNTNGMAPWQWLSNQGFIIAGGAYWCFEPVFISIGYPFTQAWTVYMVDGNAFADWLEHTNYVWPVRGGE